jgi:putative copper resistance protein D
MSLWMGSLYPLWKTSRIIHGLPLKERMHLFGKIAAFIVGVLLVCGVTIALLLLKDFNTLVNTPYGHGFIIKLLFVLCILLLAAFNKWYFTPRLQHSKFANQLGYAILFEISLGLAILLTTSYITTVVGIE